MGAGGFGARITVSATNVGGFDFIPAQSGRSIDAEAGVVWDATGGPFNNRIYLVYTDETVNENNDTDIEMRTSTDDGATWSAPVRVNDDATTNSQFLPYVALDPTSGTVAVGFHDCRNDNGVPDPGGTNMIPNDDAEYYGTFQHRRWRDLGAEQAAGSRTRRTLPTASTLVITLVCPRSQESSTRCGQTTRTAMARTRMARCISSTFT